MENVDHKPLVTVLIPCYNAMPYLPEALESIMNQTYKNIEILCINDGSTDETAEVLGQYTQQDSRIRVIHNEENLKLIATLNKGVKLAQGKYIARMDADDISAKNRIEKLLNAISSSSADLVSSNFNFISYDNSKIYKNFLKCCDEFEVNFASYFFTPTAHAASLIKTDVLKKYSYDSSNESIHCEDYELWTRLIRDKIKIKNIPESLYSIRLNPQSVSRRYEKLQIENFIKIASYHQSTLLNRKPSLDKTAIAVNRIDFSLKPTRKNIKDGILLIDEIMLEFLKRNQLNNHEKKSIKVISDMHKFDIYIQLIKKGGSSLKLFAFKNITYLFLIYLTNKKFLNYLKIKTKY